MSATSIVKELEAELLSLVGERGASKHRMLTLLAEYDLLGGWVAHGAVSCTTWWAEVCAIEQSTAREQLRVARALRKLPALDAALESDRLSYAKVKVISRLADPRNVDELIELAEPCPAGRLGVALAVWQQRNESADALAAAQNAARKLSWRTEPDGMVTFTLRARPSDAGTLSAAIDAMVMQSTGAPHETLEQQRADALLALVVGERSVKAEMIVHVHRRRDGSLVSTLGDGTPMPASQASEVLCEASVRALVHDSSGRPIDASPTRPGPTTRQMRVLMDRDKHCRHPGCRATAFLHAHHVRHRANGGPTIVANLILLCSFHHRMAHEHDGAHRP